MATGVCGSTVGIERLCFRSVLAADPGSSLAVVLAVFCCDRRCDRDDAMGGTLSGVALHVAVGEGTPTTWNAGARKCAEGGGAILGVIVATVGRAWGPTLC